MSGRTRLIAFITGLSVASAMAITSSEVLQTTGISAGLAVVLGCTDPALSVGLHNSGKIMVQVFDTDRARIQAVQSQALAAGVYGVVAADRIADCSVIPVKDNLVTLLVVDADLLGSNAPSDAEMLRAVHPGGTGVVHVHRNGQWAKLTKPRPAQMDNWTQWNYGPEANAVSKDELVDIPTGFQWMGSRFDGRGMHGAHVRIWNDLATYQEERQGNKMTVRNSFNGVLLWQKNSSLLRPSILDSNRLYYFPGENQPEVVVDARTGVELVKFSKGGVPASKVTSIINGNGYGIFHALAKGILLQSGGEKDSLWALDSKTGDLRWAYHDEGHIQFVTADQTNGRVYAAVGGTYAHIHRWPSVDSIKYIVCLNLDNGQTLWRVPSPLANVTGLVCHKNTLALHTSNAIGATRGDAIIKVLDAVNGNVVHTLPYRSVGYNLFLRDKDLVMVGGGITAWDLATGNELSYWDYTNQGCMRGNMTPKHVVFGHLGFVNDLTGKDLTYTAYQRPSCAAGVFPANGMWYATSNGRCSCVKGYRAHMTWTCSPPAQPIDDAGRLESSATMNQPITTAAAPFTLGASALAADWVLGIYGDTAKPLSFYIKPAYLLVNETLPVQAGDLTFVAVGHQHRMEARRGNQVVWSYIAGGRIATAPLVNDGKLYFGCRDGYVYCLNAADGKPVWRFLAAARDQRIAVSSQVESVWPATNVVLHDGVVAVAAGLTSEADGGTYVWGLNRSTGAIAWKFRLFTQPLNKPQSVPHNKQPGIVTQQLRSSDGVIYMSMTWGAFQNTTKPLDPVNWNGKTIDLITAAPVSTLAPSSRRRSFTAECGLTLSSSSFSLPAPGQADLRLFDARGRLLHVIFKGEAGPQAHSFDLRKFHLANAWYLLRLESNGSVIDMPIYMRK